MLKKLTAELVGTFVLVFCGTGSIIVNQQMGGVIGHLGIALTFGLSVGTMVLVFGNTSGAHINPAVSIGLALAKRFDAKELLPYIGAQLVGAFIASLAWRNLMPANAMIGTCAPSGTEMQSFIIEGILTFLLVQAVLNSTAHEGQPLIVPAAAIGGTILLDALFGGPISGASMNPARSIAPAVVSGNMQALWVYIAGPLAGSVLAVGVYSIIRKK